MVQGVDTYAGSITTRTQPDEMQVAPTLVPVFADESPPVADVLVAIPAYNEERFIGSVVHGVRMEGFDCVVVDDGSTDRTAEIATAAGAVVHTLPENRGKKRSGCTCHQDGTTDGSRDARLDGRRLATRSARDPRPARSDPCRSRGDRVRVTLPERPAA